MALKHNDLLDWRLTFCACAPVRDEDHEHLWKHPHAPIDGDEVAELVLLSRHKHCCIIYAQLIDHSTPLTESQLAPLPYTFHSLEPAALTTIYVHNTAYPTAKIWTHCFKENAFPWPANRMGKSEWSQRVDHFNVRVLAYEHEGRVLEYQSAWLTAGWINLRSKVYDLDADHGDQYSVEYQLEAFSTGCSDTKLRHSLGVCFDVSLPTILRRAVFERERKKRLDLCCVFAKFLDSLNMSSTSESQESISPTGRLCAPCTSFFQPASPLSDPGEASLFVNGHDARYASKTRDRHHQSAYRSQRPQSPSALSDTNSSNLDAMARHSCCVVS